MYPFLSTVLWLGLGGICSYLAKQRGRSPAGWFTVGVLLGLLGLILLYILPVKRKLEVSVIPNPSIPLDSEAPPDLPLILPFSLVSQKLWYFLDNDNKQYGPISFEALKQDWESKTVTDSTYVWNEDMSDWQPVEEVPELLSELTDSMSK